MDYEDVAWSKNRKNKVVNVYLKKKNRKNSRRGYGYNDDHPGRRIKRFAKRHYARRQREHLRRYISNDRRGINVNDNHKRPKVISHYPNCDLILEDRSDYNLTIDCRTSIYGNRFYD